MTRFAAGAVEFILQIFCDYKLCGFLIFSIIILYQLLAMYCSVFDAHVAAVNLLPGLLVPLPCLNSAYSVSCRNISVNCIKLSEHSGLAHGIDMRFD